MAKNNLTAFENAKGFLSAFPQLTGRIVQLKDINGNDGDVLCILDGDVPDATLQFLGTAVKATGKDDGMSVLVFKSPRKVGPRKSTKKNGASKKEA